MDLFQQQAKKELVRSTPLADRVRPKTLHEFVGQSHLIGAGKVIRQEIEADNLISMILWGPPGVGKTTLARIIAGETSSDFFAVSAVTAGVAEIRRILEKAKVNRTLAKRTILFIDEIHRFNKAQQDALLHSVEDGTVLLIGATTENPSFEVISALLSRCRVYTLQSLSPEEIETIIDNALVHDEILKKEKIVFKDQAKDILVRLSGGDARVALNGLELTLKLVTRNRDGKSEIDVGLLKEALQTKTALYDKKGEYHYDVISAFIKSVRGSAPNAALYWLARMVDAGEDPKFIARRLIILAAEDIGNADPQGLVIATSAFTAVNYIGMPEARLVLAQATTYLASAPKSNASYKGIDAAMSDIREHTVQEVPLHLRNAPTKFMQESGYAEGYVYPHHHQGHFVDQQYLPKIYSDRIYYLPSNSGYEKKIKERLQRLWDKYCTDEAQDATSRS